MDFTQPAPTLEALDPAIKKMLLRFALDYGINVISDEHEERGYFTEKYFDADEQRIGNAILDSMERRARKAFAEVKYNREYILAGFECATQDLDFEVGVLAWTDEDDGDGFRYLVAGRGTSGHVSLPVKEAWPKLMERVASRTRTKLLVLHNHPRGPTKDFIEELVGMPLGPSGTDRTTTWSWLDIQVRSGFVIEPEFVLYESGQFRRIRWPSAQKLMEWWDLLTRKP